MVYGKIADWGGGNTSSPNGTGGTNNFVMFIRNRYNSNNHG